MVAGENRDAADVDAERRAKIREWNVRRAGGVRCQEVRRLPDAAAGTCHVDRIARGVGWVDRESTDPPRASATLDSVPPEPPPPPIDAGPTDVHAWLDSATVWLSVKMPEARVGLVTTWFTESRGRHRLLEGERPTVQGPRAPASSDRILDHQRPHPRSLQSREIGERNLRIERGEKRRGTILNRRAGVIVEDRVGEIGRVGAGADAAEQRNLDLTRLTHVVIQGRRQVVVLRIGEIELNLETGDSRRSRVALNDELVGDDDRGDHLSRTCQLGAGMVLGRSADLY